MERERRSSVGRKIRVRPRQRMESWRRRDPDLILSPEPAEYPDREIDPAYVSRHFPPCARDRFDKWKIDDARGQNTCATGNQDRNIGRVGNLQICARAPFLFRAGTVRYPLVDS